MPSARPRESTDGAGRAATTVATQVQNVVKILGLRFGTKYTAENIKTLRYGHLMIMTDQDHDGSHIKGLLINCLHHFWPSLLEIPGFLRCFITPIVKATSNSKKGPSKTFFTVSLRRPSTHLSRRRREGDAIDATYVQRRSPSTRPGRTRLVPTRRSLV